MIMTIHIKHSSVNPVTSKENLIMGYKRKTLHAMLWGIASAALAMLVFLFIVSFTNPQLYTPQDQRFMIRAAAFSALGMLGIALLDRYKSLETASFIFNLIIIVGILLSDTPQEIAFGRSMILLAVPIISASILLRPWAGLVVAAIFSAFISLVPLILHAGLPSFPAILILMLIALIMQLSASNMELSLIREQTIKRTLLENQDRYHKITESLSNAILITDLAGNVTDCNPAALKLLGVSSKDEVIGRNGFSIIPPEETQHANDILAHLIQAGSLVGTEFKYIRKDVSTIIAELSAATISDWEGNPSSYVFMLQDITARKETQTALRESEEKYHRLIDILPIGVIVNQEGRIQLINPAGAMILGAKDQQEIIGTNILDIVHPDYREMIQTRIRSSLSQGINAELNAEKLVRLDGTIFDAEVVALPIKFMHKAAVVAIFKDITGRKQVEEALRRSEENFRNLSENTADAIIIATPEGNHIYANRRASELFGYSSQELLRTSQMDIADPTAYPFLKKRLHDRLAGKPIPTTYETSLRRKNGTRFPAEITGSRTVWLGQTCDLVLIRDITDRKQAQEAIKSQNQLIQEFSRHLVEVQEREKRLLASELHDDLGQSLTSLKLMLELASTTHATRKQLKIMQDVRGLVAELMGKVRNLSLDLRPAMLDDFGLFAALRWLFGRLHAQTDMIVQYNFNLDSIQRFPPAIETAAFRIVQEALTNIARHAGVKVAQVDLEIRDTLSIEISDQGIGFDFSDDIQQPASSTGLSGMQERARLLDGQLDIVSKKGSGTRIVAKIPLVGAAQ
jgi:PAS domain S-box-containing protein